MGEWTEFLRKRAPLLAPSLELFPLSQVFVGKAIDQTLMEPCKAPLHPQTSKGWLGTPAPLLSLTQALPFFPELPSVDIIGSKNLTVPFLQSVTLQCVGVGMPPPSLHWWKDGVALATSGGTLQVRLGAPGSVGQLDMGGGAAGLVQSLGSEGGGQAQSPPHLGHSGVLGCWALRRGNALPLPGGRRLSCRAGAGEQGGNLLEIEEPREPESSACPGEVPGCMTPHRVPRPALTVPSWGSAASPHTLWPLLP